MTAASWCSTRSKAKSCPWGGTAPAPGHAGGTQQKTKQPNTAIPLPSTGSGSGQCRPLPWSGTGHLCLTWLSSIGSNQPCNDTVAAKHISLSCPLGPTIFSRPMSLMSPCHQHQAPCHTTTHPLLELLQSAARAKENHTAHSYREVFVRPVLLPAHQARFPTLQVCSSRTWG